MFCFLSFFKYSTPESGIVHVAPNHPKKYRIVKPNRVKKRLRRGASSGALRGRLRRGPLTSRGGAVVAASPRHQCTEKTQETDCLAAASFLGLARSASPQPYHVPGLERGFVSEEAAYGSAMLSYSLHLAVII